ncbi:MAG TPA: SulP family inorganic anion transporter, partial [Anaerolineaceae bacterium]|nr:SulP family inorganic anion transporter [Anaerolineaceae bacterium]
KRLYQDEFRGYTFARFQQDLLAGLTVSAVALPLALAFGVASGATAAAGLVTAIIAGFVIGGLSGAPYQISGPTGAMSAVLIVLVQKYGLQGIWIAGLLSGALLLIIGLLRLGRFIAFIPAPVITGFTTGIALIIFIGQIDNFLGVKTAASESALFKFLGYFKGGFTPDWHAVVLGLVVVLTMLLWPRKLNARFPASLLGIILATALNAIVKWDVAQIGTIPQTLLLADRFNPLSFDWSTLPEFIAPALTITALGAIESLLCGAVASNMTGIRLQANQELIGQGIGNMLIPFFGGVPATAAIARSSVGIKSGGQTRMVSIIHAIGLLLSMFLLAPVMARVPLSALAGVLLVTAWRMNEWEAIRFMFGKRFKTAMLAFTITMLATITLDLTQAILIGSLIAAGIFLSQIANIDITVQEVDPEKLRARGIEAEGKCSHVKVAFVTGPLFFAATGNFNEAFASLGDTHALILSLRGMPVIDVAGVETIHKLHEKLHRRGGTLMLAGVHDNVMTMLRRSGLVDEIGPENFFWSSDQAIVEAERRGCGFCDAPLPVSGSDQI